MDWSKALRPRRILASTLITATLMLASVGAAGYESQELMAAGPLPESWRMPEARVGDRGEYTWDSVRIDAEAQKATRLGTHDLWGFEWLPPQRAAGHDGRLHDTNTLHEWGWQQDRETGEWERYAEPVYAIDRSDMHLVSYSYVSETATDPNQRYGGAHMLQAHLIAPGERFGIHCGPLSLLHGRDVPMTGRVELFGDCLWSNRFSGRSDGFRAVGTQDLGGIQAILLSRTAGPDVHVWYDPEIPYPVRVAVQDQEDSSRYDVLRLARFQRGAGAPITWDGAPPTSSAPAWEMRPLAGGSLDESGIQHPFPASKAIEAARASEEGAAFARLLDAGYISFADYREDHQESRDLYRWDFTATDGPTAASVDVMLEVRRASGPGPATPPALPVPPTGPLPPSPVPLPVPLPGGPASPATGNTTLTVTASNDRGGGPRPATGPTDGPTVASAWARWRAFASDEYSDRTPNTWGFRVLCMRTDDGCSTYREVWAGVDVDHSWDNGTGKSESLRLESILEESDNELRGHEVRLRESTYRWRDGEQVPDAERQAPTPTAGEMQVLQGTAWVMPASGVVAGTGAAAILIGLAYLLWPAVKSGGAVGLFSRLHGRDELLEHPQRQRMVQLVEAQPGIHVSEIGRRLGLGRNQLDHHLRKLQASQVVKLVPSGGYTCVFLAAARDHAVMASAGVVKAEGARRVLELAGAQPGISVREVARQAGLSPGTVAHHLKRLREAGLVSEWGGGLAVTERGRKAMA